MTIAAAHLGTSTARRPLFASHASLQADDQVVNWERRMFAQQQHDRRRFFGMAALSLAACVDWHERFGDAYDHGETVPTHPAPATWPRSVGATAWLNSAATDGGGPSRQSRARRLLDLHLHQLASHTAIRPRLGRAVQEQGLVVIGVHTPEFSFEENVDNVRKAAKERGVTYPIAIDNNRAIWSGFGNHYWPALYFIDAAGRVRDHHFGEGNYEESEMRIRQLLAAAGSGGGIDRESVSVEAHGPEVGADWGSLKSPETYVGHHKAENFASPGGAAVNTRHVYAVPPRLRLNQWALSGEWTVKAEAAALNAAGGRIAYRFHARDLHLIMGPAARARSRSLSSVDRWTAAGREPWK